MIYNKLAKTVTDQINQLHKRGLIITNKPETEHYLNNVGYYRLSGYWWSMLADKATHAFKIISTFDNVIAIYNFDKELRLLLFEVIESIEIALRNKLIHYPSLELSPWWFEEQKNFKDTIRHTEVLNAIDRELQQTKEVFIKEHYKKYHTDRRRPPAWKTLEVVSFGTISKLYGNLNNSVIAKNIIAQEFGIVNHTFLPSWLQAISQIRNMCAHHSRLWNKNLPGAPRLMHRPPHPWLQNVPTASEFFMLYVHLCCMKYLLNCIKPKNDMTSRLIDLLTAYENIDPKALGLKPNWQNEQLWK